jgi:hypothetical protein
MRDIADGFESSGLAELLVGLIPRHFVLLAATSFFRRADSPHRR